MRTRIFILCWLICGWDRLASERLARRAISRSPDLRIRISRTFRHGRRRRRSSAGQWRYDSTAAAIDRVPRRNPRPPPLPPHVNVAPMTAQAVPVLPAVFRGCWQGQVNELDWIRREPGAHKIGFWTPKTYRLCYKQVGDQPFKLTFTETGVEPNDKIINPRGKVVPIATDGRAYATMRSRLEFRRIPDAVSTARRRPLRLTRAPISTAVSPATT